MYDNSSGYDAQTTAVHCDPYDFEGDPGTYYANYYRWEGDGYFYYAPLTNGYIGGSYDIQWHDETPDDTEEAAVDLRDGSYLPIYDGVTSDNQMEGETVCQSGQIGGYVCGFIYQIGVYASPPDSNATYVEVQSDEAMCRAGDSGGPIFSGNYAYGTIVSRTDYYIPTYYCEYMPMEYVYDSGLSLHVQ